MNILVSVEKIVKEYGDEKALRSFYLEYRRRLFVVELVKRFCAPGSRVVDLGAQPFILSCMLAVEGFRVTAVDIDPAPYAKIAEACGIDVVESDLEKSINLPTASFDCAIFSEVLEHLNPYYIHRTMFEINRVLVKGGYLILTTPNVASLFRRLKLLLGFQPICRYHVREYTMHEVLELLNTSGFEVIYNNYNAINDLTYTDCKESECIGINSYIHLLKLALRRPTKTNILRALAYPLVRVVPSLRMLIVVVGRKVEDVEKAMMLKYGERWS